MSHSPAPHSGKLSGRKGTKTALTTAEPGMHPEPQAESKGSLPHKASPRARSAYRPSPDPRGPLSAQQEL